MSENEQSGGTEEDLPVSTVAHRILGQFCDELQGLDGFANIAARLHEAILDKGTLSDAAIRVAIFGDDAT